jgi:phosphoribosylformylglycinamidine cyclo-ligase
MRRTFNLGIGMIVAVPQARAQEARRVLESEGEVVHEIGVVADGPPDGPVEFVGPA